jgi:hypothetical protein
MDASTCKAAAPLTPDPPTGVTYRHVAQPGA